jgi:hypothetical protein
MKFFEKLMLALLCAQAFVFIAQGALALPKSRPRWGKITVMKDDKALSVEWVYVVEQLLHSLDALKNTGRAERMRAAYYVARDLEENLAFDFKQYLPIQAIIAFLKETDARGFSAYANARLNIPADVGFSIKADLLKAALLEAVKNDYPDVFAIIVMPPDMRRDVISNMVTEVAPSRPIGGGAAPHINRTTKPPYINRATKPPYSTGIGVPSVDRSTKRQMVNHLSARTPEWFDLQ